MSLPETFSFYAKMCLSLLGHKADRETSPAPRPARLIVYKQQGEDQSTAASRSAEEGPARRSGLELDRLESRKELQQYEDLQTSTPGTATTPPKRISFRWPKKNTAKKRMSDVYARVSTPNGGHLYMSGAPRSISMPSGVGSLGRSAKMTPAV